MREERNGRRDECASGNEGKDMKGKVHSRWNWGEKKT